MKITLAEIKTLETSLSKIFEKDLNIKIAYRLGQLLKRLSEEMKTLEEHRVELVKKHGTVDEETKQVSVAPENTPAFYKELGELMNIDIDIPFEAIPLADFGDIELSAADVLKLSDKIIAVPEEAPVKEAESESVKE